MIILDGKKAAEALYKQIRGKIKRAQPPAITMVLVGEHPSSLAYVTMKQKAAAEIGMRSAILRLPETIAESDLIREIEALNQSDVDGILVQMPLPKHINSQNVTRSVSPDKDVDGLHPYNAGLLSLGDTRGFVPCTPLGIKYLLDFYEIPLFGTHIVILGRSNLVGRPLAALLSQKSFGGNATVTLAHSQSTNLREICAAADILVAAIGVPHFVKGVKEGAVVVDVGITRVDGKLMGDVDFEAVKERCTAISPVPGGVGPMTIACLLSNTLKAHSQRAGE